MSPKEHFKEYLLASALAAGINYPLWRVSAMGQSGFQLSSHHINPPVPLPSFLAPYAYAFAPPYKGMIATILGMTWARAAIFFGSDVGKELLRDTLHCSTIVYNMLPPLMVSTMVQCINQPVVRASITLQNPAENLQNVRASVAWIYHKYGLSGLWHGTSAGILKTVPKYCTAILVKDYMEAMLPHPEKDSPTLRRDNLCRAACKSAVAGLAGAALTNPFDVIRNEMFKTNLSLFHAFAKLREDLGWRFIMRGMGKNMIAVSIPVASTIFFTDALIQIMGSNDSSCY